MVTRLSSIGLAAVGVAGFAFAAAPAGAEAASMPAWTISSISTPTNFAPGSTGNALKLIATNVGGAPTSGNTTVTDELPPGLTTTAIGGATPANEALSCQVATVSCALEEPLLPEDAITIYVEVSVSSDAPPTVMNEATVSGGGALLAASTSQPTTIGSAGAAFGIQSFTASVRDADGSLLSQAGGAPYAATVSFALNTINASDGTVEPTQNLKDTAVDLPPGFLGDPLAAPRCSPHDFPSCAPDTQVGQLNAQFANFRGSERLITSSGFTVPIYNMVPSAGTPAEFKSELTFGQATLAARLRSGGDYGVSIDTKDISEGTIAGGLAYVSATLWGVPGDPSHNAERGRKCIVGGKCSNDPHATFEAPLEALLRSPTFCGPPLTTTLSADPWQNPGAFVSASSTAPTGTTGCGKLSFTPAASVEPETSVADSPTGLHVDLHVPQNDEPDGLAEPDVKKAVVTLPQGMTVNPSAASGIAACSPAQIDLSGPESASCPDTSKVGSVEVDTPLIDHPLHGAVYLAQQGQNPFGSLLALYIAIDDPASGTVVKLAGHVVADPQTGQLTTTFDNNPQLPFEDLKLDIFGGPRAPLVTPASCGGYQTTSALTPWSVVGRGDEAASVSQDPFQVNAGCVTGFAPSFLAGTLNPAAGASSAFTTTFARSDQDEELGGITVRAPSGLLGKIAGIPLCGEPQAAEGACSPASQIGHVNVTAGAGSSPVSIPEAGKPQDPVYLTGPYKGAPFGLSIVVPAQAGPFNLGTVVVRAAIHIDPHTAQVTIVSDPLPQILQGIPLKVRQVNVVVDRAGFMLNPTSCDPMSVDATLTSVRGVAHAASSRFQAASCASLRFEPSFSATTTASGTRRGASLDVKVAQKPGEADIRKVDTQLPLALPSRLVTLQKACPEAQFAANPAGCPAGSNVGMATARTPILSSPLNGPAYLVSHGGAAFPDLDIVLQGEGVEIVLTGKTDIKRGITFSRFETVPDAPVSSFELKLPAGPGAVLAATKNLCAPTRTVTVVRHLVRRVGQRTRRVTARIRRSIPEPLLMPTTITGQNGAVVHQTTRIAVSGCARPRAHRKAVRNPARRPARAG
jgi:hypothetical protein